MNSPRTALSPPNLIRNGFDWSGKTARLPYILVALAALVLASFIPVTRNFTGGNTAVFVALTMVFPIWLGHTRRRLRDVGWSGWCMWLAILPIVGLLLTIFLAFKPGDDLDRGETGSYSRLGFAVALACGAFMLSRAFWAPYWIPAASMKPALLIGDFVAVVPINEPRRGDVLVFKHPQKSAEFIKRLIGMPGDTLQMIDGAVHLNGAPLKLEPAGEFVEPFTLQGAKRAEPHCQNTPAAAGEPCLKAQSLETLPEGRSHMVLDVAAMPADETGVFTIPEGHYFFLGDNRDNSLDSRFDPNLGGMGYVPRANLTGRAAFVLFSSAGDSLLHVWTWRADRLLRRVE